ncbi:MAG: hypothetical protein U0452_08725 [Anaerolineae bacterium]
MDDHEQTRLAGQDASAFVRPYSPSWVDRLTDWVDGLPWPGWVCYVGLWLLLLLAVTLAHWADGSYPVGTLYPLHLVLAATTPYALALIHHLDGVAGSALVKFRPALDISDEEYDALSYRLTTLPSRSTLVASVVVIGVVILSLVLPPDSWWRPAARHTSELARGVDIGLTLIMWWTVGAFVYHTVHQLRLVSRIYSEYTHINLFSLIPLYAFSELSALTAVGLLVPLYAWFLVIPDTFGKTGNVILAIVGTSMAGLIFVWPLLGIHRLLSDEKERLLAESAQQFEAARHELHTRMRSGEYGDIEGLVKGMDGLDLDYKAVNRISTWPWAPDTVRWLIAALLFPLIVWFSQWVLQRTLGP